MSREVVKVGLASDISPSLDPFLYFRYRPRTTNFPGFVDHPHRGFETVTHVLEGGLRHEDFAGHKGILNQGDLQWMTAGRGIVHCEVPLDNLWRGIQMWVNLPKKYKMCEPRYQDIFSKDIPTKSVNGVTVQVIAGESMGMSSPTQTYTPVNYLEFKLEKNASFTQQVPNGWTTFIFILEGNGVFGEKKTVEAKAENTVIWSDMGDTVSFKNEKNDLLRLLLISGQPLKEPVIHGGAFVMNTQQEIEQAHQDFYNFANGFERARTWKSDILKQRMSAK